MKTSGNQRTPRSQSSGRAGLGSKSDMWRRRCPVRSQVGLTARPPGARPVDWPPLPASSGLGGPGRPTPCDFVEQGCDARARRSHGDPGLAPERSPACVAVLCPPCLHLHPQVLIPKEPLLTPDSNSATASGRPGLPGVCGHSVRSQCVFPCVPVPPPKERE